MICQLLVTDRGLQVALATARFAAQSHVESLASSAKVLAVFLKAPVSSNSKKMTDAMISSLVAQSGLVGFRLTFFTFYYCLVNYCLRINVFSGAVVSTCKAGSSSTPGQGWAKTELKQWLLAILHNNTSV
ncbi:unnamed protein product [Polarella glacialis]|uniref:Uncharacterized protein n=1 Tax=Polarella glacialis TaxID=89957 RepID=A0A813KDV0_POLGL|nr:unnamed protein product [Polarella glacialis]CAE8697396.1 unnamed protein product [Polarella glacialis]